MKSVLRFKKHVSECCIDSHSIYSVSCWGNDSFLLIRWSVCRARHFSNTKKPKVLALFVVYLLPCFFWGILPVYFLGSLIHIWQVKWFRKRMVRNPWSLPIVLQYHASIQWVGGCICGYFLCVLMCGRENQGETKD